MKNKCLQVLLCCVLCLMLGVQSASAVQYDKIYLENDDGMQVATMPKAYLLESSQSIFGEEALQLSAPCDLFVAPNQHVYVADTGNHRIIELDNDLNFVRVYDNRGEKGLKSPEGVFVDEHGALYIADTGNARVVKLSSSGDFVEEFGKPQSALLADSFVFNPRRVAVSSVGYLYALKFQYVMQMDAYNDFRGYIGTTEVGVDLWYTIKYLLSNAEQRKVMLKREPASCFSFDLGADGSIYVTTADRDGGELKHINSVGKNIYPKKSGFGFPVEASTGTVVDPQYVDVGVDQNENVYLLESITGEISVYSSQGDNLCVFGGKGNGRAQFETPVALDVDEGRSIFVLDQKQGSVKKFVPTRFMTLVYTALAHFDAGEYETSEHYWQQILDGHESYALANEGKARLKYKQKDYRAAMDYYRMANDRAGYSEAFAKWEMQYFRDHFAQVLLAAAAGLLAVIGVVAGYRRYVKWKMDHYNHLV